MKLKIIIAALSASILSGCMTHQPVEIGEGDQAMNRMLEKYNTKRFAIVSSEYILSDEERDALEKNGYTLLKSNKIDGSNYTFTPLSDDSTPSQSYVSKNGVKYKSLTNAAQKPDEQEAKLRQQLPTEITVERKAEQINLVIPHHLTFGFGSSELKDSLLPTLDSVATSLKEFDESKILVVGHTDSTGPLSVNEHLSLQRAKSVLAYLELQGVRTDRLKPVGMGPKEPVTSNETREGRAQNRRVEIHIQRKG